MAKKVPVNKGGRPSIFGSKAGGARLQGVITVRGSIRFEQARDRLAKLVGKEKEDVSDADVIEYLSLGEVKARTFLAEQKVIKDAAPQ